MLKANSVMLKALKKDTTNKENIGLLNIFKVFKHILTLSTFLVVYMKIILPLRPLVPKATLVII